LPINKQTNNPGEEMFSSTNNHAKMCSWKEKWGNMQDVFMDQRMDEHALFMSEQTYQACQHARKEKEENETSSKPNDHRRQCVPFHAVVKL